MTALGARHMKSRVYNIKTYERANCDGGFVIVRCAKLMSTRERKQLILISKFRFFASRLSVLNRFHPKMETSAYHEGVGNYVPLS